MKPKDAPDIFAPGLNASMITDHLVLGSRPLTVEHLQQLRTLYTVSHILDVCEIDDKLLLPPDKNWADYGYLGYSFNPTADDHATKPISWFKASLDFALPLMIVPGNVVYIHCESGMDRGAVTTYAVLRALGLSGCMSWALVKKQRPEALWLYMDDAENAIKAGW